MSVMKVPDARVVMAGYSAGLLSDLDGLLPPRSVLVLEEPEIIRVRRVHERAADFACLAGVLPAATQDEDGAVPMAAGMPRPEGVRAVIPGVEYGVVAAAALAAEWGLPGAGLPAARILRDKLALRDAAAAADIPQPAWRPAYGAGDVAAFRAAHGGACVLKPANRQASLGVQLLGPDDDIGAAWARTATADEPTLRAAHAIPGRYLVEQRLTGPEVSVETLVREGVPVFFNITAKSVQPGRHPVELGHVVPADLPPQTGDALHAAMSSLIKATGFECGILHGEWILVDGVSPHLVECAGRGPGDSIDTLIDLAHGGSLLERMLTLLQGETPALPQAPVRAAAIRFLTAPHGRVRDVTGTERAAELPGVLEVRVAVAKDGNVAAVTNSWERPGHVVATGATAQEAAETAERALAAIAVTVTDDVEGAMDAGTGDGAE
ncbi:ATP-grasp domain-containing protein [Streptomyces malaysiensis]